jgi:hypothetical protein
LVPVARCLLAWRHLRAFPAQLSVNLEPIYAIVLAAVLFGEQHDLSARFYAGVAIILGVVFAQGLLARRRTRESIQEHPEVLGVSEAKQFVD